VVNGSGNHETADLEISEEPESDDEALFESDEEEIDDEQPCPSVVQDLEISLGSPVFHISVPCLSTQSARRSEADVPELFTQSIVAAVATADGTVKVITLPLDPPSAATKRKRRLGARVCTLTDAPRLSLSRGITMTWTESVEEEHSDARGRQTRSRSRSMAAEAGEPADYSLLVATATAEFSGKVNLYRVPIHTNEDKAFILTQDTAPLQTHHLSALPTRIAFSNRVLPSSQHSLLCIADVHGYLRVFDPLGTNSSSRPSSQDSHLSQSADQGSCIATFTASFYATRDPTSSHPGLARRKKILDAQWIRNGRSILALLEDGEWGVWDLEASGSQSQNRSVPPLDFVIRGFVGDAPETSSGVSRNKPRAQLAPMTPNTRRVREDNLFSGPTEQPGIAARGGISVVSTSTPHGVTDDSIAIWYNSSVHTISSTNTLWQRSTASSGRDVGSLYGPGLSRVEGLELNGEIINNIAQLPLRQNRQLSSGLGTMNIQRDLLITAEHRVIIHASTRPHGESKGLFSREPKSPSFRQDKVLLDRGDLDLGGMDRMLDSMVGVEITGPLSKVKRVGFAAH